MIADHCLTVVGTCPVDGTLDVYHVRVTVEGRTLFVERILEEAAHLTREPIAQEALTEALAYNLCARVVTVGTHSGVETTCEADGA